MNPETFFDKFGLLADTPNGVQKLRELILQLAVQGKLVRQDANDEPAAVLLEKIKVEKERLVKEKKIRKPKPLPSVKKDEYIFEIPKSWKWVHIGEMILVQGGKRLPQGTSLSSSPTSHIYIRVTDMKNGSITDTNLKYINADVHQKIKKYIIEKDDLYITIAGTIGQVGEVPKAFHGMNLTENAAKLVFRVLNKKYALFAMQSHVVQFQFKDKINQQAQPKLALKRIANTIIPLPPIKEQRRIVAKVDQLMALCDELEARQQKKQETRLHLNSAALDKLLTAHEPAEFANHWQRVCDNFDLLYDNPETVGELRKAILQLAVQGKLVQQDENDESAAVLLEKIKAEKERLVEEGKIRKTKPVSSNDIENPYELPANWKWARLFDIGVINPRNKASDDIDASFVPMTLISETYSTPVSSEKRLWGEIKTGFTHFAEEDVVLAKITPCFQNGKSAVMRGLLNGFGAGTTELHVFRPLLGESVNPEYVLLYLKSPQFLTEGIEKMTGTAGQKRVTRDYFAGNPFPLPPFEEQRRIVAKVDQLMALCDELEAKLKQSQTDGAKLMEAVVAEIVSNR